MCASRVGEQGEGENPKQAWGGQPNMGPRWGWISPPSDHDLSGNQESHAQPTELPRHPEYLHLLIFSHHLFFLLPSSSTVYVSYCYSSFQPSCHPINMKGARGQELNFKLLCLFHNTHYFTHTCHFGNVCCFG